MKKIVVVPAGRRRYLEILLPILARQQAAIDQCRLWLNTSDPDDRTFITDWCRRHSQFFELVERPWADGGVWRFYDDCTDQDTAYLKLDDDIVWLDAETIARLFARRIIDERPLLIYANTVNSPLITHLHQRMGLLEGYEPLCNWDPWCECGWRDGRAAETAHRNLLARIDDWRTSDYDFREWRLLWWDRVSINAIAFLGRDMQALVGELAACKDDELFLASHEPRRQQRPNAILGNALAAHWAFGPQRTYMDAQLDILAKYKSLANS